MIDWLLAMGGWAWGLAGLVLMAAELLAPGMILIWLGLAALLTGAVVGATGLGWQASALLFAALSLACVLAGRRLTRRDGDEPDAAATLNSGSRGLIGRRFVLDRPLSDGVGQLKLGDSVWRITGPDAESGSTIRVTGIDGTTLQVEKC